MSDRGAAGAPRGWAALQLGSWEHILRIFWLEWCQSRPSRQGSPLCFRLGAIPPTPPAPARAGDYNGAAPIPPTAAGCGAASLASSTMSDTLGCARTNSLAAFSAADRARGEVVAAAAPGLFRPAARLRLRPPPEANPMLLLGPYRCSPCDVIESVESVVRPADHNQRLDIAVDHNRPVNLQTGITGERQSDLELDSH